MPLVSMLQQVRHELVCLTRRYSVISKLQTRWQPLVRSQRRVMECTSQNARQQAGRPVQQLITSISDSQLARLTLAAPTAAG
jgi:hypothetical protein